MSHNVCTYSGVYHKQDTGMIVYDSFIWNEKKQRELLSQHLKALFALQSSQIKPRQIPPGVLPVGIKKWA